MLRNGGIDELLTLPPDGAQPIIDGLLYEGQTAFLIGAPGSGKSYFAIMLSILAAAGENWYGKFKADIPRRVLYVATEGSVYDIQERVVGPANHLDWGAAVTDRWQFWVPKYLDFTGSTDMGRTELQELQARADAVDLIVVDSFYSSFMGTASSDEIMGKVAQNVAVLKASGKRTNKSILFVHHDSREKFDSEGNQISREKPYLGSVIIEAMADQMWHYEGANSQTGAAKFRQIKGRSRHHKVDSFYVMLEHATGVLLPKDAAPTLQALAVEKFFRQAAKPVSNKDLETWAQAEAVGERTARRHRDALVEEGKVEKVSRGEYQWVRGDTNNVVQSKGDPPSSSP